ncbi:MAG TPA: DsrE family protein [bacterium]
MSPKSFVFILTAAESRPDLPAGALQLATNMKANDAVLDIFLMDEAAVLAKPGAAEALAARQKPGGFSPVHSLLKTLVEDFGVKVYVCASCVKPAGLDPANLAFGATVKPGSFLGEMLMEREGLTF